MFCFVRHLRYVSLSILFANDLLQAVYNQEVAVSDFPQVKSKPKSGCASKLIRVAIIYAAIAAICAVGFTAVGIAFVDALPMAAVWPYFLTLLAIFALAAQR